MWHPQCLPLIQNFKIYFSIVFGAVWFLHDFSSKVHLAFYSINTVYYSRYRIMQNGSGLWQTNVMIFFFFSFSLFKNVCSLTTSVVLFVFHLIKSLIHTITESVSITTKVVSSSPHSWRGVLDITLCDKICHWFATGLWFSPDTSFSSNNKTDRHDITEILLKVALNTNYKPNHTITDGELII